MEDKTCINIFIVCFKFCVQPQPITDSWSLAIDRFLYVLVFVCEIIYNGRQSPFFYSSYAVAHWALGR